MQELLLSACDAQPTVIIVDELQRADAESLALLATLATEAANHALLLVVSAERQVSPSDAYLNIRAQGRVLELEPLRLPELQELTANVFGGAANSQRLAQWLHEQTGGNPGSCMSLMRILVQRGLIRYTAGTFTLPHDVGPEVTLADPGAALRARLQGLSASAREVALALSLQEVPTTLELLTRTLGLETRPVVLALEQLSARGIACLSEGLATLVSASWKEALASSMDEPARSALHLRFARAMLADSAALTGRARMQAGVHLLKAGEEQEAVTLLTSGMRHDWIAEAPPVAMLETILELWRKQGRTDEHCLHALVPLVRGGFYGEMEAQRRHFDRTLHALANVCGVTLMARLAPYLGAKLALMVGLVGAGLRTAFTPKDLRFGTLKDNLAALLTCVATSIAAFASALEPRRCAEILAVLAPLRALGPGSVAVVFLDFCQASIDLGSGRFGASRALYEKLLEQLKRPLSGLDPRDQEALRHGVLHGLAQGMVMAADPEAIRVADELERAHMFYAPHAQNVKMGYYGYRGETDRCEIHRKRGEVLALRGGISWSSVVVMALRSAYVSMEVSDPVALVRISAELERLSSVAPNSLLYRDAVRACLELLRGRPQAAAGLYERLFAHPNVDCMVVRCLDRTFYAKALSALGRHAEAKRVCEQALAELDPLDPIYIRKFAMQQLALVDAALGDTAGAARALDAIIETLAPYNNPLWSGGAHRDRAKVALFALDRADFDKHARAMEEHFKATRNPALIQQCELLQSAAALTAAGTQALDDAAIAFESHQARLSSAEANGGFETELSVATVNERAG
jgi:tetratricopeptide (TPR) repeat protein